MGDPESPADRRLDPIATTTTTIGDEKMTPEQIKADDYDANTREVAPSYDADVYYSMRTYGDYLECGKCGWKRPYAMDSVRAQDRSAHATPVRNPSSLDIACPYATWAGAMATAAILN